MCRLNGADQSFNVESMLKCCDVNTGVGSMGAPGAGACARMKFLSLNTHKVTFCSEFFMLSI